MTNAWEKVYKDEMFPLSYISSSQYIFSTHQTRNIQSTDQTPYLKLQTPNFQNTKTLKQ